MYRKLFVDVSKHILGLSVSSEGVYTLFKQNTVEIILLFDVLDVLDIIGTLKLRVHSISWSSRHSRYSRNDKYSFNMF